MQWNLGTNTTVLSLSPLDKEHFCYIQEVIVWPKNTPFLPLVRPEHLNPLPCEWSHLSSASPAVSLYNWIVTLRRFSKIAWVFLKMRCLSNKPSSDLQVIEKKLYHLLTPCSFSPSYACRMWCTCSLSRNTMSQGRRRIWTKRQEVVHWFILAYLLLLALPCTCFLPNFWSQVLTLSWKSHTHQYITERSIVNVTLESLRATKQHPAAEKVSCTELYTLKIGKEELLFTIMLHSWLEI